MEQLQEQRQTMNLQEDEIEIDLKEMFFLLLNHWKSIFLAILIGGVLFGAYHALLVRPSYQADAEIYITNTDSVITFSDLQMSAALTDDYARIIKSRVVLNRVIRELQLDLDYKELSELVEVNNPDSTHIIEIIVTCDDLELSRNIANALLNVSVDQIYQIIGSSEPTVIDYSEAEAVEDVTPSLAKYMIIGGLLGAVLVCAVLIVRMLMDTTMHSEEDVDRYLQLPVLASVPYLADAIQKAIQG